MGKVGCGKRTGLDERRQAGRNRRRQGLSPIHDHTFVLFPERTQHGVLRSPASGFRVDAQSRRDLRAILKLLQP
jgi:hypothetical protein